MSQNNISQEGTGTKTSISAEAWKKLHSNDTPTNKEIESGTERPKILMPGSPLENLTIEEDSTDTIIVSSEPESMDYTPYITSGCGFIIGILVSLCFFRIKVKKIKQEYEAKISEARESLDRAIKMFSAR